MARWHVVVTVSREGSAPATLRLDRSPITVGGASDSDVVLAGSHVSRAHALVTLSGGRLEYRDRSTNGSFVNGRRIEEVVLRDGDVVTVPPYRLTFSLVPAVDGAQATSVPSVQDTHAAGVADVPAGPSALFRLRLIKGPAMLQGRIFPLAAAARQSPTLVGRAADAQICLDLPSVSRRHAVLTQLPGGEWQVADAGSRNGLTVNGQVVTTASLRDGDRIGIGPDIDALFERAAQTRADELPSADGALVLSTRPSSIDGTVLVMCVAGRLDGYNYSEFRDRLNQVIDAGHHRLLLDFAACLFCDHVGLSVVLSAKTALDKQRGALCLIGVDRQLREGLSLLRLDGLLAVEADEPSGVRRLMR